MSLNMERSCESMLEARPHTLEDKAELSFWQDKTSLVTQKVRWADLEDSDDEGVDGQQAQSSDSDGDSRNADQESAESNADQESAERSEQKWCQGRSAKVVWADLADSDTDDDSAVASTTASQVSSESNTENVTVTDQHVTPPTERRSNVHIDRTDLESSNWSHRQCNNGGKKADGCNSGNAPARQSHGKGACQNVGKGHSKGWSHFAVEATGKGTGKATSHCSNSKGAGKAGGKGKAKGDGKGDNGKHQCQFLIGIEEDGSHYGFGVVKRIIGKAGANMKSIAEKTDVKLRLRGRGSNFLEGPEKKESTDELMLCVSGQDQLGFAHARDLVSELLLQIYSSYRGFCKSAGKTPPELGISVHEGPREGSR